MYLANDGDVICVSNFDTAMLNLPIESSKNNDDLLFQAWTRAHPAAGHQRGGHSGAGPGAQKGQGALTATRPLPPFDDGSRDRRRRASTPVPMTRPCASTRGRSFRRGNSRILLAGTRARRYCPPRSGLNLGEGGEAVRDFNPRRDAGWRVRRGRGKVTEAFGAGMDRRWMSGWRPAHAHRGPWVQAAEDGGVSHFEAAVPYLLRGLAIRANENVNPTGQREETPDYFLAIVEDELAHGFTEPRPTGGRLLML